MKRCTCEDGALADTGCPTHGLDHGEAFPPMDRHALPGEDAAAAQRRLYLRVAPDRVRVEAAGFPWPIRPCPAREAGQR